MADRQSLPHLTQWDDSLFRDLIATTINGVIVIDESGIVEVYNDACEGLFQYTREEVLGKNVSMLMPSPFREEHDSYIHRYKETGEARVIGKNREIHAQRKDGTIFPILLSVGVGQIRDRRVFISIIQDRTALHRERSAYEDEKARLAVIVQSSNDAIVGHALDGTVTIWNRAAEVMSGYAAHEVVGKSLAAMMPLLVPPDQVADEIDRFARVAAGEYSPPFEATRFHKNGSIVHVSVSLSSIRDAHGAIVGVSRTVRDNSDRRHAEEALRATLESIGDAFYSLDGEWRFVYVNAAAERLLGMGREELLGRNLWDVFPQARGTAVDNEFQRSAAGETGTFEYFYEPWARWFHIRRFPRQGGGIAVYFQDITERKANEEQKSLLASVVEASNDAIYTKTLDGIITSVNKAAEELLGYEAHELVGQPMLRLFPPDRYAEEDELLAKTRTGQTVRRYESVRVRKDGALIDVSVTVSPIRNSEGAIIGAAKILRDITERKLNEARLQELRNELGHVARVSEMTQVSAGIAHELNQPLSAILNYTNVAKRFAANRDPSSIPNALEAISKASEQAVRAGKIIRRLRDFVEKRESNRTIENINSIVEDAMALGLIGTKSANITMRIMLAPDTPPILADRIQIQQVLVNLLRNAIEAMAESPRRELTLSTATKSDGALEVLVTDTGPGIPKELADRLFKPFVTTKPGGMGIGLAISRSIIVAHGGQLNAVPNAGGGAVFQFTLPAAQQLGAVADNLSPLVDDKRRA